MPKQPKNDLTAERARELLSYDPETGVFRWRVSRRGVRAGSVAGTLDQKGYRRIGIYRRWYLAHRLAWLITHGRWPADLVDHVNGVRDDNRIANIREATRSQNQHNQKRAQKNSKTGVLGVRPCYGKYRAEIGINGKNSHLGLFETIEEAAEVYRQAKREAHPFWHDAPKQRTEHRHL